MGQRSSRRRLVRILERVKNERQIEWMVSGYVFDERLEIVDIINLRSEINEDMSFELFLFKSSQSSAVTIRSEMVNIWNKSFLSHLQLSEICDAVGSVVTSFEKLRPDRVFLRPVWLFCIPSFSRGSLRKLT